MINFLFTVKDDVRAVPRRQLIKVNELVTMKRKNFPSTPSLMECMPSHTQVEEA